MELKDIFEADNHVLLYGMFHVKHYGMFFFYYYLGCFSEDIYLENGKLLSII